MKPPRATEKSPVDLVEEAARLLRSAPASLLCGYYLGGAPFVLAFLFFWADMSASPFAPARLLPLSGLMALLYLWMKTWQAAFVIGLRGHYTGSGHSGWPARRVLRLAAAQTALQPSGLLLTPLSLCLVLPFPIVVAFYHDAGSRETGPDETLGAALRQSARRDAAAAGRDAALLSLLTLLAVVVFINVVTGLLLLPNLLKILTGEESLFTRDFATAFNTTFLAIAAGITYLCVDPLARAAFLLRAFYAESAGSGEDLRLSLRHHLLAKAALALVLACLLTFPAAGDSADARNRRIEATARMAPTAELNSDALNKALHQTLQRDEFAWRLPKASGAPEKPKGLLAQFFSDLSDFLARLRHALWLWLLSWFRSKQTPVASRAGGGGALNTFLTFALLLGSALLALWFWRWLVTRRAVPPSTASVLAVQPAPDLADESQRPDALPSDQWMRLALEMAAAGQTRLALRAFYLAGLAHLASKEFIQFARCKSNYDYVREVTRRTRANPGLVLLFRENVDQFDRAWYGRHPVDGDTLSKFESNTKALLSC